jgi:tetratricopeptide (TPR) repeat protein
MRWIRHRITLLSLVLCAAAGADIGDDISVGARAIGMGSATTAIASDVSTVSWNPAGIAFLQRQEVGVGYADRFGMGRDESYLSYVLPLREDHALGVEWFRSAFGDGELDYQLHRFGFAYAFRASAERLPTYLRSASVGLKGRRESQSIDLDGRSVMEAAAWGADLGLLASLPNNLRLGMMVRDIGSSGIEHDSGLREPSPTTRLRLGLGYRPVEGLTLAADIGDRLHLGGEYWIAGRYAIRLGVQSGFDRPGDLGDATTLAVGAGVRYRSFELDYAFERHPILEPTHFLSATVSYNPRVVAIGEAGIRPNPVFRSLYRHYQENDFFDVVLSNRDQEPIRTTVSLFIPGMMSAPHTEEVVLSPQSTRQYSFQVTFDEELFHRPEANFDGFVQPTLAISYTRDREPKDEGQRLDRVYVAGRGKLSWSVPGMIAAFVTPADPAVEGFARGLLQKYDALLAEKFNRSNIGKAVLLFDALGAYRIRYQVDRRTPFASIADNRTVFDTVQYPSELLAKTDSADTAVGDCDDLTALYASLLENLGIDTALLEANEPGKGHIYLMFDTGIHPDAAEDWFVGDTEYVRWEGRVWIPVETTLVGHPFADAWRNGVAEYRRLGPQGMIDVVDVQKWLQVYKSANLPAREVTLPAASSVDSLLREDLEFLDRRVDRIALGDGADLDDPDDAYLAGIRYLRIDYFEKAAAMFQRVLTLDPHHVDALNTLGVTRMRQRRYSEALQLFERSLAISDSDPIRRNLELARSLMGESP